MQSTERVAYACYMGISYQNRHLEKNLYGSSSFHLEHPLTQHDKFQLAASGQESHVLHVLDEITSAQHTCILYA